MKVAEEEGFEPPVDLRLHLISSQVPLTTQPLLLTHDYCCQIRISSQPCDSRAAERKCTTCEIPLITLFPCDIGRFREAQFLSTKAIFLYILQRFTNLKAEKSMRS